MTKILVIEDEIDIRENLTELLSDKYEVFSASGGRAGLEVLMKEKPDLVLCDVTMPGVDGYGVLTAMRHNPATANTPFIFLTAKCSKDDVRLGMELTADDYLTKPYTRRELFSAIEARLRRVQKLG